MAIRHGNRCYVQLLLDPHKAELLKDEAQPRIEVYDHLRTLLYKSLERSQPSSVFNEAQAKMKPLERVHREASSGKTESA